MPGYTLVPVDYQPDFGDYRLIPVDYDPFAGEDLVQQARLQQPASAPQTPGSAPPLPPMVPNGGQAPSVPQPPGQDPHSQYLALRPMLGDRNAMLATVYPELRQTLIAQAQPGQTSEPAPAGDVSGVTQQAQTQTQPAPQIQPQKPATGAGQPGVNGPATGTTPNAPGGGTGVGNAGIGPSNTTWAQGGAPAFTPLGGYANPTPTESLVNQAQKEPKKVQIDLITADSSADPGSSDIHQKIVDRASAQIGSGAWHFEVAKGNFPEKTDKCNLFVYDMLTDAGASPGLPKGHWWNPYPPLAENWADPSFAIPGWRVLSSGEIPQPGDVVGQRIQWPNRATGHVMIVGPNATFIGVGESEKIESVAPKMMGGIYPSPRARPGGLLVYRRYEP